MTDPTSPPDPYATPVAATETVAWGAERPAPRPNRTGLWVALGAGGALVAGLIIGSAVTALYLDRDDIATAVNAATVTEGEIEVEGLAPGDCFDETDEDDVYVGTLTARPCTGPHDSQTTHTFELPAGSYPGDDEIDNLAGTACEKNRVANPDLAKVATSHQIAWYTPDSEMWADGDRRVVCIVTGPVAPLTAPIPVLTSGQD